MLYFVNFFLLYTFSKELVNLLRGKVPVLPSHRFGVRVLLEEICCGWLLKFKFCLNKGDCSYAVYLYGPVEPNVYG